MCQYIETFHTYSDCRLKDVETSEEPEPQRLATLMRMFATSAQGDNHCAEEPDGHLVKERNIFQCANAVQDPALKDMPAGERVCANPICARGEVETELVESVGYTRERGDCPVCQAVERVIGETLNRDVVRPVQPPHPQNGRNPRPQAPHRPPVNGRNRRVQQPTCRIM